MTIDGRQAQDGLVVLRDDGAQHQVEVALYPGADDAALSPYSAPVTT